MNELTKVLAEEANEMRTLSNAAAVVATKKIVEAAQDDKKVNSTSSTSSSRGAPVDKTQTAKNQIDKAAGAVAQGLYISEETKLRTQARERNNVQRGLVYADPRCRAHQPLLHPFWPALLQLT